MSDCCGGTGWYKKPVPFGHPDFGKLFRCECGRAGDPEARRTKLNVQLKAYAGCTFETWNAQRPVGALEWGGVAYPPAHQRKALVIATKLAYEWAQNPSGMLYIYGSFGAGKTHLASAIGHVVASNNGWVEYHNLPELLDSLRAASSFSTEQTVDDVLRPLLQCDVLILDDIGTEELSQFTHGRIFRIIDERLHKATIFTSNIEVSQMAERVGGRLHSRFQLAPVIWLPVSDYRQLRKGDYHEV